MIETRSAPSQRDEADPPNIRKRIRRRQRRHGIGGVYYRTIFAIKEAWRNGTLLGVVILIAVLLAVGWLVGRFG